MSFWLENDTKKILSIYFKKYQNRKILIASEQKWNNYIKRKNNAEKQVLRKWLEFPLPHPPPPPDKLKTRYPL